MADKKYVDSAGLGAVRDWADDKFQPKLPEISATDNGKVLSVVEGQWEPTELQEELPEVTSADNGKVLAVVAGEWEKAEAPDELPAVSASDNGKVLSVVQGEWAKATPEGELPEVSASDNGKFLGVVNGAWGKAEVNALPAVTAQDNGKVLGVVEGQWAKTEPEDGLPEVTSSDNGKVLSVVEGAWAPAEPTGGSGLPEVTSEDNGDLLSVVDGAWAKSEPGYRAEMVDGLVIIPEQDVTTVTTSDGNVASISNFNPPDDPSDEDAWPETLQVTFDGTEYTCPREIYSTSSFFSVHYGNTDIFNPEPDPSALPFELSFSSGGALEVSTLLAGTYTIKAATPPVRDVIPSSDFKLAVNNCYMETTETEKEVIPEQTLTSEQDGNYSIAYPDGDYPAPTTWPDTLIVTFNGTEYTAPVTLQMDGNVVSGVIIGEMDAESGDPVFTNFPFSIYGIPDGDYVSYSVATETAQTFTLSATYTEATTAPTEKFKEAVKQSGGGALIVNDDGGSLDKTWQEIFDAYTSGTAVVIRTEEFIDNDGDGDELNVLHSLVVGVSTRTITTQGEETMTYLVDDYGGVHYHSTSAGGYPSQNSDDGPK